MGTRIAFPYVPFTDAGVEGGPEELCMLTPVKECNPLIRAFFQYFSISGMTSTTLMLCTALHRPAFLPTTYAWPVSSMEEESDSFLDMLVLQAALLRGAMPNDLRKRNTDEKNEVSSTTLKTLSY